MSITLVEALKMKPRLVKKAEDLRQKISQNCAHMDNEKPVYGDDQQQVITGWLQAHSDIVKKIEELSIAIQVTNLKTQVEINLGGRPITKSIAEWILWRQGLAQHMGAAYSALSDRGLRDREVILSDNKTKDMVKVVRYFNPIDRDTKADMYRHEPSMIDAKLEVTNATTQLAGNFQPPEGE